MVDSKGLVLVVTSDRYFIQDVSRSLGQSGFEALAVATPIQAAHKFGTTKALAMVVNLETLPQTEIDALVQVQKDEGGFPLFLVKPAALNSPTAPHLVRMLQWPIPEQFLRAVCEVKTPIVFLVNHTLFMAHVLQMAFKDMGIQPIALESPVGLSEFLMGLSVFRPSADPRGVLGKFFTRAPKDDARIMGHVVSVLFQGTFQDAAILAASVRKAVPQAVTYYLSSDDPVHQALESLRKGGVVQLMREQADLIGGLLAAGTLSGRCDSQRRESLLLVDNDRAVMPDLARGLLNAGFAVDITGDGKQACELVKTPGTYHAVIIGTNSTHAKDTGMELGQRLRSNDPDLRFIFMMDRFPLEKALQGVSRLLEWGADEALLKPVDPAALVAAAQRAVKRRVSKKVREQSALSASAPADAPGRLLRDKYELVAQIGEGGMGVVFKAYDRNLDRFVAVKKMRPELRLDSHKREQFIAEARMISKISNPLIVGIHEIIEDNDELFLVLDYVEGRTLSAILKERQRFTLKECQEIFGHICFALSSAHQAKILHRDLKPSNIMFDTRGYIKILDFGLARVAQDTSPQLTVGETSGTLAYMAPEQHLGHTRRASDIYALGVCLYELLT
ncbi:MAG: protein kinase, partial [Elusimicrobia bacterium]|nr:protein kinase [Elusimicrobiota bacterium]